MLEVELLLWKEKVGRYSSKSVVPKLQGEGVVVGAGKMQPHPGQRDLFLTYPCQWRCLGWVGSPLQKQAPLAKAAI